MTIYELFDDSEFDRDEFGMHMGWSRPGVHQKLTGKRGWSPDEIELAGTWLRAHGVPVTSGDITALVRAAAQEQKGETT
jgi:hypothetical protein